MKKAELCQKAQQLFGLPSLKVLKAFIQFNEEQLEQIIKAKESGTFDYSDHIKIEKGNVTFPDVPHTMNLLSGEKKILPPKEKVTDMPDHLSITEPAKLTEKTFDEIWSAYHTVIPQEFRDHFTKEQMSEIITELGDNTPVDFIGLSHEVLKKMGKRQLQRTHHNFMLSLPWKEMGYTSTRTKLREAPESVVERLVEVLNKVDGGSYSVGSIDPKKKRSLPVARGIAPRTPTADLGISLAEAAAVLKARSKRTDPVAIPSIPIAPRRRPLYEEGYRDGFLTAILNLLELPLTTQMFGRAEEAENIKRRCTSLRRTSGELVSLLKRCLTEEPIRPKSEKAPEYDETTVAMDKMSEKLNPVAVAASKKTASSPLDGTSFELLRDRISSGVPIEENLLRAFATAEFPNIESKYAPYGLLLQQLRFAVKRWVPGSDKEDE